MAASSPRRRPLGPGPAGPSRSPSPMTCPLTNKSTPCESVTGARSRRRYLGENHHVHDVMRVRAGHLGGEGLDAVPQAADNGLSLAGNAQTLQVLGLGVGLSGLHYQHLLSLCLLLCGHSETSSCVNLVHGNLNLVIGADIGHQRVNDAITVAAHQISESCLDFVANLVLQLENLVDGELRYRRAYCVEHVGSHLRVDVRELEERVEVCLVSLQGLVLHGDHDVHEHVVQRLHLARHI
mmetsp:Transcript_26861/g.58560  ORF Transcript_26861/g.58560 Transcript_26861/m.58560 type:complete len:238 (-) Transcript_26861:346-1059(-)